MLTISDHLDWKNEKEHLVLLQNKLNAYLRFVESGEMADRFPEAGDRAVVFDVVGKFPPSKNAQAFFEHTGRALHQAGFKFQFRLIQPN